MADITRDEMDRLKADGIKRIAEAFNKRGKKLEEKEVEEVINADERDLLAKLEEKVSEEVIISLASLDEKLVIGSLSNLFSRKGYNESVGPCVYDTVKKLESKEEAEKIVLRIVHAILKRELKVSLKSKIDTHFNTLKEMWGSKQLFQGDLEYIIKILSRNLKIFRKLDNFLYYDFEVSVEGEYEFAIRINNYLQGEYSKVFAGIILWRTENKYFVCGNSLFS